MIREIRTFYVKHLVKNLPPTLDEIKKAKEISILDLCDVHLKFMMFGKIYNLEIDEKTDEHSLIDELKEMKWPVE